MFEYASASLQRLYRDGVLVFSGASGGALAVNRVFFGDTTGGANAAGEVAGFEFVQDLTTDAALDLGTHQVHVRLSRALTRALMRARKVNAVSPSAIIAAAAASPTRTVQPRGRSARAAARRTCVTRP